MKKEHNPLATMIDFLELLENNSVAYQIHKYNYRMITVSVFVPGEHWEVEFGRDGEILVEKFTSMGLVENKKDRTNLLLLHSEE